MVLALCLVFALKKYIMYLHMNKIVFIIYLAQFTQNLLYGLIISLSRYHDFAFLTV